MKIKPTFEQWRDTRRDVPSFKKVLPDDFVNDASGYYYAGAEWIISDDDGCFDAGKSVGRFASLDEAERALFAFLSGENHK